MEHCGFVLDKSTKKNLTFDVKISKQIRLSVRVDESDPNAKLSIIRLRHRKKRGITANLKMIAVVAVIVIQ